MSASINSELLPKQVAQRIAKDLVVSSAPTKYGAGNEIEVLITTIENQNDIIATFPFAYYYQNIAGFPNEKHTYPQCTHLDFQGKLNKWQSDIEAETFATLDTTRSVMVSLSTGMGKTIFAIYIACKLKLRCVILCHRLTIISQWESSIARVCPAARIQIVGTKTKILDNTDFIIMNVTTVAKRDSTDFRDFGLLVVDEAHVFCTANCVQAMLKFQPRYLVGLTATPERTDKLHCISELFFGPNIITRKLYRMFNAYIYRTGFTPDKKYTHSGDLDWNSVLESQCGDKKRNKLIVDCARFFASRNILILCKRVDQVKYIHKCLVELGENTDFFTGSQTDFKYECRVLVSTFSKSGVGFSYDKLDMMIVGSDVLEGIIQYLGRVIRREDVIPIIVDFEDNDCTLKKHLKARRECYLTTGAEIKKLEKSFPEFVEFAGVK